MLMQTLLLPLYYSSNKTSYNIGQCQLYSSMLSHWPAANVGAESKVLGDPNKPSGKHCAPNLEDDKFAALDTVRAIRFHCHIPSTGCPHTERKHELVQLPLDSLHYTTHIGTNSR